MITKLTETCHSIISFIFLMVLHQKLSNKLKIVHSDFRTNVFMIPDNFLNKYNDIIFTRSFYFNLTEV